MEANELMIGDWVTLSKGNWSENRQVELIDIEMIAEAVYFAEPIPLTPEILKKNGFYLDTYEGFFGKFWIRENFGFCENGSISIGFGRCWQNIDIKYVHELQHLFKLLSINKQIVL